MRGENWCAGSGGGPSLLDPSAAQKTGAKHQGKPIWAVKCVVCGRVFNILSKHGPVPEHDRPVHPVEPDAVEGPKSDSSD